MEITEQQIRKGELGENVIFDKFTHLISTGGFLLHSYVYPMTKDLPGNIKKENGRPRVVGTADNTELDLVLCTKNYIYPIEVKTYSGIITITKDGIDRHDVNLEADKSPVHQNEMHCRHLYDKIYFYLPNGDHNYIKPMVVFADRCKIEDLRTKEEMVYIPVFTINNAFNYISTMESRAAGFCLDVKSMYKKLMEIGSCKKSVKVW